MKVFTKHHESFHKALGKFSQSIGKVFTMERDSLLEKAARTMPSLLVHFLGEFSDFSCHIVTDLCIYLFIMSYTDIG
ncbi:MAG: hypothetical protein IJT97_04470 [Bacteroidaceae bacterium]|nr:hypothetical protein [Bacteroidaceae bacterium]